MFVAAYPLPSATGPQRAIVAVAVWFAYAVLDLLAGLPMMAFDLVTPRFALSLLAALAAGLTGAAPAVRRNRGTPALG